MVRILETIKPAPDRQYRLRPCRCRSENVAYEKLEYPDGRLLWRVRCFDCGATVICSRPGPRHAAQIAWNTWTKEEICKTTTL